MEAHKFTFQGKEIRLTTAFDNGALARVEESERNVFECWPYEKDEYQEGADIHVARSGSAEKVWDGANVSFHFRMDGCRHKKVVFRFHVIETREEGVSVLYANPDFPVFSYDRKQWHRTTNKSLLDDPEAEGAKIVRVEQTFTENVVWIAYQYPYSNDLLSDFIESVKDSRFVAIEVAGHSTEGRDIRQISVTDPAVPLSKKKVVWLTGLQHCAETGAGWGLEGMVRFLLSEDPIAAEARRKFLFKIIPIVNVDALAEGRGRIHSSGKNLNREWEEPDPQPEIASIRKTLDDWKGQGNPIDIFMDFHGFSSKNGKWTAPVMPEGSYTGTQASQYNRLLESIRRYIPQIVFSPHQAKGLAQGAGCRRWEALSLSIDGWGYQRPSERTPDLSSYYEQDGTILDFNEIQAAGELFVRALVEFARG